jgi:hypothetical protein
MRHGTFDSPNILHFSGNRLDAMIQSILTSGS